MMKKHSASHSLRIIGGNWRGRKVSFANNENIRPTPDRVRETLFNWLQGPIKGARCLELFGGSGILSLEALSRGAQSVVLIDKLTLVIEHLKGEFSALGVPLDRYQLENLSAEQWLNENHNQVFDIVFLDPPFAGKHLDFSLQALATKKLLSPDCFIYIESPREIEKTTLPSGWTIERQKKAGAVHYCLCRTRPA